MEDTATPPAVAPLSEFPHTEVGSLPSLLPDTPWTTTALQACERRTARAWVDNADAPQCVAVLLPGDPELARPPVAFVFGTDAPADALVAWVGEQARPLDVVCDDDIGLRLLAAHPEATVTDMAARWFERLDAIDRPESSAVRRLRLRDAEAVEALAIPDLLGAFESLKDLLMVGGASAVVEDGHIAAAAFTVDQSVNYARILAYTEPDRRREGLALAACRHLVAAHHEQGRLACALVAAGDAAAQGLARAIGFESASRVRRYRLG